MLVVFAVVIVTGKGFKVGYGQLVSLFRCTST